MQKLVPPLRFSKFNKSWVTKNLGDLLRVERGGSPRPISKYITTNENGVPWIKIGDLENASRFVTKTEEKITSDGVKNSREVFPGDFILSNSMSFGRPYIVKIYGCIHDGWLALRNTEKDKILDEFLYELLQSQTIRKKFLSIAAGSAVKNLKSETVKAANITIPPIEEQQKIASFLSKVDGWIENLKKQREEWEKYKRGMMQKIFSQKIRFKDSNGREFSKWEEKRVSDVFGVTRGYVLAVKKMRQKNDTEFKFPVYSSQTLNNGLIGYFNKYLYENAITWTTDGANAGKVNFRQGKFYCTNVCGVLIDKLGNANSCIAEMLSKVTKKYVSYVGNPKLMNNVMGEIKIKFPSVREQQKIANFLTSMDKIIEFKQKQIDLAENWKKGLMQRMFM